MATTDPKVAEYRRQMAARYASLPAAEKPHLELCDQCRQPVHVARVCRATGLLHEREKMRLVGGMAMDDDKKQYSGRELMSCLDASRVKWQASRVARVRIDGDANAIFQSFPVRQRWQVMRCGILYGTFDKPNRCVSVHAIYEPEQRGDALGFQLGVDPREQRVDELAALLGMERVGICVTHPPRDTSVVSLSAVELLLCAREQSRFGDHCVIVTVAPDPATKQIQAQGWQTSEQCVRLFQMGVLAPSVAEGGLGIVHSSVALEVARSEKDEKGNPKLVVKEPSKEIDAHFMLSFSAIEQFHSELCTNLFVRISRAGEPAPTLDNLDVFLKDQKRAARPFHERVRDFHVLVFLMEAVFGGKPDSADMKAFVAAMLAADPVAMARFEVMVLDRIKQRR